MSTRFRTRTARLALVGAATMLIAACVPVRDNRGYQPDDAAFVTIAAGTDTRQTIQQKLGTPSSLSTFGDATWYYISSVEERVAFFKPDIVDREILAITFDEAGQVAEVRRYYKEDGRVIAFVDRETPTRGKQMTVLQQLFGNLGRGLPGGIGGDNPAGRGPR